MTESTTTTENLTPEAGVNISTPSAGVHEAEAATIDLQGVKLTGGMRAEDLHKKEWIELNMPSVRYFEGVRRQVRKKLNITGGCTNYGS